MENKTFTINGLRCEHCEARAEKALCALDGVQNAKASVEKKQVVVEYDPAIVTAAQMQEAVDDAGYEMVI